MFLPLTKPFRFDGDLSKNLELPLSPFRRAVFALGTLPVAAILIACGLALATNGYEHWAVCLTCVPLLLLANLFIARGRAQLSCLLDFPILALASSGLSYLVSRNRELLSYNHEHAIGGQMLTATGKFCAWLLGYQHSELPTAEFYHDFGALSGVGGLGAFLLLYGLISLYLRVVRSEMFWTYFHKPGVPGLGARKSKFALLMINYGALIIAMHLMITGLLLAWDASDHLAAGYFWTPLLTIGLWTLIGHECPTIIRWIKFLFRQEDGYEDYQWTSYHGDYALVIVAPIKFAILSCLFWNVLHDTIEPYVVRPVWTIVGAIVAWLFGIPLDGSYGSSDYFHDLGALSFWGLLASCFVIGWAWQRVTFEQRSAWKTV